MIWTILYWAFWICLFAGIISGLIAAWFEFDDLHPFGP